MDLDIEVFGEAIVRRKLLRAAEAVGDHREAFLRIAGLLDRAIARNFSTQGASSGPRWADLKPATIASKLRSSNAATRANATRVLMATGALAESLHTGGADHIQDIDRLSMRWGSRNPYGVYHQSRKPRTRLPHRPPARLSANAKKNIVREMQRGLFKKVA